MLGKMGFSAPGGTAEKGRVRGTEKMRVDGITFASRLEARRYVVLRDRARAGQISNLQRQVPITLQGQLGPIRTPKGRPMRYIADFRYLAGNRDVIEDAKGFPTDVFLMKRAILAAQGIEVHTITDPDAPAGGAL